MREFSQICKDVEKLDPLTYREIIATKSLKILPVIDAICEDTEVSTPEIMATFLIGSIISDGKIDESEYLLIYPSLRLFFGEHIDYESCKKIAKEFKYEGKVLKQYIDYMVDILGLVSEDIKEDIITICLLICAVDGKISYKEKQWIKQLIK